MRRPEVMALIGACFLMSAAHGAYYTFYSIYLVDNGYSKSLVGWLWALGGGL
ncbi:MFS transporter [Sulfuriferula sp.]|uniref:MFS transporter n=1 Tax=Sulfuriferula sp. TaxID=2025307 RepID=UPI00272FB55E|nr:MFS transporter [Sulfuriferula sp.]MDP2025641.1 MFS transporter [Sulfuriferula sp.]